MKRPIPVLVFGCTAVVLLAAGCEDSQARRRSEIQAEIVKASADLKQATSQLANPDQRRDLEQRLNQVIHQLGNASDGAPGQRAAAAQLTGIAQRRMGWIALDQAYEIEAGRRVMRSMADSLVDTAMELDSLIVALEAIQTDDLQDELVQARREASDALTTFSEQLANLDGPIAEGNRQNRTDREEADRLREEALLLHEEAADLGAAGGYSTFSRGLDLDRQADQIEYDIAQREIEMHYTLESEHALAETSVQRIQERIEAIDGASDGLDELAATADDEARATRALLDEIGNAIDATLAELDLKTAELDEFYEGAVTAFQRAASTAKSAANWVRGNADTSDAIRLAAAQAYQEIGRVYTSKARGHDDQAALLEQLAEASGVVDSSGAERSARALREAAREAATQAQTAYANAGGVLDQVSGRTGRSRLEVLKASMSSLESAAAGEPVKRPTAPAASSEPAPSRAPAEGPASIMAIYGAGAESPEALVAAFSGARDMASLTRFDLEYTWVELRSLAEKQFFDASLQASRATLELEEAFQESFGTGFMQMAVQASGMQVHGMAGMIGAEVTLGGVSGDHGTIEVTADGETQQMSLIRTEGRWYVDGTDLARALMAAVDPQSMAMIQTLAPLFSDLARRVRGGEFASVQEAMMAMGEAMMPQMSGSGR